MEENKTMSAPTEASKPKRKTGLWVCLILLGLLVCAYLGLCAYVFFGGRVMPNVTVGRTDLSNMTWNEARAVLESNTVECRNKIIPFTYGNRGKAEAPGTWVQLDVGQAASDALAVGREGFPLTYGARFFVHLTQPTVLELPVTLTDTGSHQLSELFQTMGQPVTQTSLATTENGFELIKGVPGYTYDLNTISEQLLSAFSTAAVGDPVPALHFDPARTEPDPIDWESLGHKVYVEPVNAAFNTETYEIEPSITGVSLDIPLAQRLYDDAGAGSSVFIPFTFTEPEVTTEYLEATLFSDLLGEATSRVTGVANRRENVRIAASMVNGTILLPEDIFAYNVCTGSRTLENGFLPAPSYVNGLTVDEVGGGICQVSSTVYYASLLANLEIVERQNHSFAVGYVPDGLDATVFYGKLDFRFKNNTEYPIKLVTSSYDKNGSRWLNVKIYGTKTDDTYVKMECNELSSTPHEVIYQADETIPVGTLKEQITPYRGRKVEVYRCIYAADGTLISRTLESINNYKKRDQLFLYNPADAALYDPNYQPPVVTPEPAPTDPVVTPPAVTTPPLPTEPVPSEPVTAPVDPAPAPDVSPTPAPTEIPPAA